MLIDVRGLAAKHNPDPTDLNNAEQMEKYYGKFRGKVRENLDPLGLGRIRADVPKISGMELNWCMPCVPYTQDVSDTAIPPVGTNVWIEFEGGDLESPIWSGCFWE